MTRLPRTRSSPRAPRASERGTPGAPSATCTRSGCAAHDVARWARHLAEHPQPSGKAHAPASIARRLSCLSSFYGYAIEVDVLEESPVANVKRPRVGTDSLTVGLTRDELEQLLEAAEANGTRSAALITLLAYNGLRVDEALSRNVEHLGHQLGHRVLRVTRK